MFGTIVGNYLKFSEFSPLEIRALRKLLSWEDDYSGDKEELIFSDDNFTKTAYTFWGLYDLLPETIDTLEIVNPPELKLEPVDIDNTILTGVTLYSYQLAAAKKALMLKKGICEIPTAGGKTEIILAILKHLLDKDKIKRGLVVVPSVALANQFKARSIERGFDCGVVGVIHAESKEYFNPVTVAVVDSLTNGIKSDNLDILNIIYDSEITVFDECFPAGTLVDKQPIETLQIGDYVTAFDETTGKFNTHKITRLFKNPAPEDIVQIKTVDRTVLYATENHPFWTKRGWVNAGELTDRDYVYRAKETTKENIGLSNKNWASRIKTSSRGGWIKSLSARAVSFRSEKEHFSNWIKLDSVTIQKFRDMGFPRKGGSEDYVYNIEVENLHTYTANSIVVHNCHHWRSSTWLAIAESSSSTEYLLGFSGSPVHNAEDIFSNSGDTLVYGIAGKPIYKLSMRYLIDNDYIATPYIFFKKTSGRAKYYPIRWDTLYNRDIVSNSTRNNYIRDYATKFALMGLVVLILVQRHEHAKNLIELMPDTVSPIVVFGGGESIQRDENQRCVKIPLSYETFQDQLQLKTWNIIIATQVFDEGVDMPSVGAYINGGGGRCFLQGTKIKTADGSKFIENIAIGDMVFSSTEDANIVPSLVVSICSRYVDKYLLLILVNEKTIKCTLDHPFMLRDGTYKEAQYLEKTDILMSPPDSWSLYVFSKELVELEQEVEVYDIQVKNTKNISNFLLDAGCVVHNSVIKTLQRLGRAVRKKHDGVNKTYIIDFDDRSHVFLKSQSNFRKRLYEDCGLTIMDDIYSLMRIVNQHQCKND